MTPRTHTLLRLLAVAALVVAAVWPSAARSVQRGRVAATAPAAGRAPEASREAPTLAPIAAR